MKANEINEFYYNKLVSLNYSRKENDLESVNSLNWFDLDPDLKEIILTFPNRHVKFDVDLMDIEDLDREQQFYLFLSQGKVYLVDTQGYNYPRYIVELEGFDSEDVTEDDYIDRMEGLIRIADDQIFNAVVKSLVIELRNEDFCQGDILNFLQFKLDMAIEAASK
jgi:hypothetical protein